ncbi:hypothetical protein [Niallia sp. Krafla_26]|uniref:hypothetical protein n=1 Tax=Niallia sp. Krafla_26 TaxID=3064703 RepID=UPI003D1742F0
MFNQKAQKKNEIEWEKQILRINTLEVQIKGLLEFEKQIRTTMYRDSVEEKKEKGQKNQRQDSQGQNRGNVQKFDDLNKKLEKLGQRVYQLEHSIEEKRTFPTNPLLSEVENKVDKRLIPFIEQILEKEAIHLQIEKQMVEKIQALENQISMLNDHVANSKIDDHREMPAEDFSTREPSNEKMAEREVFYTQIDMRVQLLEHNLLLVNEVQSGLLKRLEELSEKSDILMKHLNETEDAMKEKEPIFKTLYVDKLYLDKYEQNNNFAQLGIKTLSGALNIGATYGKEAIPKKVTEQVKEDMDKMKEMKEEMENSQPSTDKPDDTQHDDSSSEAATHPSEENLPYTDIVIEDDESSFGESNKKGF